MRWEPILDGTPRDLALEAIHAIADATVERSWVNTVDDPGICLGSGCAGGALLHGYLSLADHRGAHHGDIALRLMDAAIDGLGEAAMPPGLFEGFTGIAWADAHLTSRLGTEVDADRHEPVGLALEGYLSHTPWRADYDLIRGLTGFGAYALERQPGARADSILARVIAHLAAGAVHQGRGVTWHTPARPHSTSRLAAQYADGYVDLGVAHGVPGVIALLGAAAACGSSDSTSRSLLERAVTWLLDQRLDPAASSVFPHAVAPEGGREPARLAWCYGDAGVAASLMVAARGAERDDWEQEALRIARRAAERPLEFAGVNDAGLCHGAAGIGHIFNRLYQATGESWLADAARTWFARTLHYRRARQGIGGFLALERTEAGEDRWHADPGLLTGASGIGLALLSACCPLEPEWDRVMLLEVP